MEYLKQAAYFLQVHKLHNFFVGQLTNKPICKHTQCMHSGQNPSLSKYCIRGFTLHIHNVGHNFGIIHVFLNYELLFTILNPSNAIVLTSLKKSDFRASKTQ